LAFRLRPGRPATVKAQRRAHYGSRMCVKTGGYTVSETERQLRWALKLYWQTQKEHAARAARPQGEAREADDLREALEQSLGSTVFETKQSHQVIENTEEVSGIGQNKAKSGNREKGETGKRGMGKNPFSLGPFALFPREQIFRGIS